MQGQDQGLATVVRRWGWSTCCGCTFVQHWFNLIDAVCKDALLDSTALRRFVGIDLLRWQLTWQRSAQRTSSRALAVRADAIQAWEQIARALGGATDPADGQLAVGAIQYLIEVALGGQGAARVAAQQAKRYETGRFAGVLAATTAKRDRAQTPNQ